MCAKSVQSERVGTHLRVSTPRPDAGSPNRVLNLARMLVLATEGRWVSKPAGAAEVRARNPEFADAIDEALRARAESRWMDPAYAESLSTAVRAALG